MELIKPIGYIREGLINRFNFTSLDMSDRPEWEPVYVLSKQQRAWLASMNEPTYVNEFMIGFDDKDGNHHYHFEKHELIGGPGFRSTVKTIDRSKCPSCEVTNGTDGAPEGGSQPTR